MTIEYIVDQAIGPQFNRLARAALARTRTLDLRPFVSIHVAVCNEPPGLVIETLEHLTRLAYPRQLFEVVVVDNNTPDDATWRPVQAWCADRPGFEFYRVAQLAGAKAGALNFALRVSSPRAQVIAVVDCDYHVEPMWLAEFAGLLANPFVGYVQLAQDYRGVATTLFARLLYQYYVLPLRSAFPLMNEDDATFTIGPMALISRQALIDVGGWDEDSITEDHSLGFALHAAGYAGHYFPVSRGRGVMPQTFAEFRKQRWRWCAGPFAMARKLAPWYMPWRHETLLRPAQKKWERRYLYTLLDDAIVAGGEVVIGVGGIGLAIAGGDMPAPWYVWGLAGACLLNRIVKLAATARHSSLSWWSVPGLLLVHDSLYLARITAPRALFTSKRLRFERADKFPPQLGGWRKAIAETRVETFVGGVMLAVGSVLVGAGDAWGVAAMAGAVCLNAARKWLSASILALVANHQEGAAGGGDCAQVGKGVG